jgi:hypothetical protein
MSDDALHNVSSLEDQKIGIPRFSWGMPIFKAVQIFGN